MRICPLTSRQTKCTDHCKECVRDELKLVKLKYKNPTEAEIISEVGEVTYELMLEYGLLKKNNEFLSDLLMEQQEQM